MFVIIVTVLRARTMRAHTFGHQIGPQYGPPNIFPRSLGRTDRKVQFSFIHGQTIMPFINLDKWGITTLHNFPPNDETLYDESSRFRPTVSLRKRVQQPLWKFIKVNKFMLQYSKDWWSRQQKTLMLIMPDNSPKGRSVLDFLPILTRNWTRCSQRYKICPW